MGITASSKMFGAKELQGWHKESLSAVDLRKNILGRRNLKVKSSAPSKNVMREVVETMGKRLENSF